jgi:hypothetical protein
MDYCVGSILVNNHTMAKSRSIWYDSISEKLFLAGMHLFALAQNCHMEHNIYKR